LLNLIKDDSANWVIDVGCNDPIHYSNSYFFEKYLGCKVLAIDPLEELEKLWKLKRPKSIFLNSAVGNNNDSIILNVPEDSCQDKMFSYVDGGYNKKYDINFSRRNVKCERLESILQENKIDEVLLLTIDVEGFEYEIIKGINFEKVRINCICVENNSINLFGSDLIRQYLINNNYIYLARIGYLDDIFIHKSLN
jgi:FkbM family methyltransferase